MRLYEGSVPSSYKSEYFALDGIAGLWSVSISAHDLKETSYYIAVLGKAELARYRITSLLITSEFKMDHKTHAEVCEDQWLYFMYTPGQNETGGGGHRRLADNIDDFPGLRRIDATNKRGRRRSLLGGSTDDHSTSTDDHGDDCGFTTHGCHAVHISIHVWRYSGSFFLQAAHGHAPIKLVPPFKYLGQDDTDTYINLCDVDATDTTSYLGLFGSSGCALMDLVAHKYVGGNCSEPRNFAEVDAAEGASELTIGHFTHGSCTPGGYAGKTPIDIASKFSFTSYLS